ncbi:MAG: pyruvate formate-lyase, partial [Armatimonadetes bacterium]|nr:pyruvate formate-lyase [Armatimonadota bacterium]
ECSFLLASLLTDDCLERGRAALDGGLHRMGACVVGQGYTNTADALTAIRELVYERQSVSLAQLVAALDANYQGLEALRAELLAVAKFGNDDAAADALFARVWGTVHTTAHAAAPSAGLDYLIVSSVNPGGFDMGVACGATADGRGCGQPFAIGTAPTAGRDTSGLTALFNSLTHIGSMNGGATTNLKISREYFTEQRHLLAALLEVFFEGGGLQASVTSVGRDELLDAQLHPERNTHVLVRVGGFTARFVELDPVTREEILARTLY